jgi:hypothetical protein
MILIAPRSGRQADSRLFAQTDLVGGDFKVPALVTHARRATNPRAGDERPLLFFGMCDPETTALPLTSDYLSSPLQKSLGPSPRRQSNSSMLSVESMAAIANHVAIGNE